MNIELAGRQLSGDSQGKYQEIIDLEVASRGQSEESSDRESADTASPPLLSPTTKTPIPKPRKPLCLKYLKRFAKQILPVSFVVFLNLLEIVAFGLVFLPPSIGNSAGFMLQLIAITTIIPQFFSTVMSQFGSIANCANADSIPFVHTMAFGIAGSLKHTPEKILPTVLIAVAMSTLINGILFTAIGLLKMGKVLHFFPRYVILGMILGFGVFMIETGYESSTGMPFSVFTIKDLTFDM